MRSILPLLLKDAYKIGHPFQYPQDTALVYSNLTPRSSRVDGQDKVVWFGAQYFVLEYLRRQFLENFFTRPLDEVLATYRRRVFNALGPDAITLDHIAALHKLGYLPLKVKSLPEGTLVPLRVPCLTIRNTHPGGFFWLTNMVETLMSNVLWMASTSATTAFRYRRTFESYGRLTGAPKEFIPWQGHDFSMRGMSGVEAACLSGAGHLLSFTGTDTIPAIDFLEDYYQANSDQELIGGSVPATEHAVMCVGSVMGSEIEMIRRLITEIYPKGIVSIVCDTWDFWRVLTEYLPALKQEIMARDGKVVVRPDSGDPVEIICGTGRPGVAYPDSVRERAIYNGAIETLWNTFGGTRTSHGYCQLDSHIGLIYGDSITPERQQKILSGLRAKGFASSNVVLGIGSYTYQHVTRDTYGWAIKATYCEDMAGNGYPIFKAPATDDGTKNSAKGLLMVDEDLTLHENVSWEQENQGLLRTIFESGEVVRENLDSLKTIRARVESSL